MAKPIGDTEWMRAAACKGHGCEFHPPEGEAWDPGPVIMRYCLRGPCPVLIDCELYARTNGETCGVWGGIDFGKEHRRSRRGSTVGLRERVVALAAKGYDTHAIAELLNMAPRSVGHMLGSGKRKVEA